MSDQSNKSDQSGKACSPAPVTLDAPPPPPGIIVHVAVSPKQWPLADGKELYLKYYFMDGSDNRRKAVKDTIAIWSTFANVIFDQTQDKDAADIRISFKGPGSWSAFGTDARLTTNKDEPTMSLGWLGDSSEPSAEDKGTILHEFGHILGMKHEYQSPARGGYIHLNELAVYQYYRPLLNYNDRLVKTQVIDPYNKSTVSNFSRLDLHSIMMYFMPSQLNEEGIDIPVNTVLSDMDKAFITLNYPRKVPVPGGISVAEALEIAGVSGQAASTILGYVDKGQYMKAREEFANYNNTVQNLTKVNKLFLATVNPADFAGENSNETIVEPSPANNASQPTPARKAKEEPLDPNKICLYPDMIEAAKRAGKQIPASPAGQDSEAKKEPFDPNKICLYPDMIEAAKQAGKQIPASPARQDSEAKEEPFDPNKICLYPELMKAAKQAGEQSNS
ncbi:peptidase m12a astacin [Moniliophthora roreri MCA 2997]|uniref:Peptidase m12a astacin n=1 Tax=Moniliophthora roreri (strain MCA 2997) TaxID=1381753 RepID=V2WKR5_MONRO|nr:peptidase m12a astacin [Moniliophthora roreri MCA 2997]